MTINAYNVGDQARISGAFTTAAGVAQDPTALTFKYTDPSGNVTTLVYNTDAALVKDSTGNYHVDIDIDERGRWFYRWIATGTGAGSEPGEFMVEGNV